MAKKQGIDDAFINLIQFMQSRQSLDVYSKLAIAEAQGEYGTRNPRISCIDRITK
jgi:hypothetical protein